MSKIIIPEQKVKGVVDYILNYLKKDYKDAVDKSSSYLHLLFGDYSGNSTYDYWKNSVALFTRGPEEPRAIETHFFLNRSRFSMPTVHITMNADQNGPDGIGFDNGWDGTSFQPSEGIGSRDTGGREFNTRFQIVITSDNTFDVLIIYHTLMACLIGNSHLLTLNGLQNPTLKGGDIILNDQSNPSGIYARAIFLDCFYSIVAPSFNTKLGATDVEFQGTPNENPEVIYSDFEGTVDSIPEEVVDFELQDITPI
jgi:hypothetical protein